MVNKRKLAGDDISLTVLMEMNEVPLVKVIAEWFGVSAIRGLGEEFVGLFSGSQERRAFVCYV